jgi:putative ABC transport system permease protein
MILIRILKNELSRKKGAMIVVFAFMLLSALLAAGGAGLVAELNGSLGRLFSDAKAPHFVQMHAGEVDREAVAAWARRNSLVEEYQTVEMISIDGSSLFLSGGETPEENSIMDISFVAQNSSFDYLLDLENRIVKLSPGEIGVPVYYAEEKGCAAGDKVAVTGDGFFREYTVTAIVRDAQMNPAIVHSKRFLFADSDYDDLSKLFPEREYLIEFRLTDPDRIDEFSTAWQESGLPQQGPAVDYRLFTLLNALSDGIVAAVVIILSLLLVTIAVLCLRFTILAAVEEDYREIGVMKAIGMPKGRIKGIYLIKYIALGGLAALGGYALSLPLGRLLTGNILLYIGRAPKSPAQAAVPVLAAAGIFLLVLVSAQLVQRRFNRISAVEALRAGSGVESVRQGRAPALRQSGMLDINIFLGFRDVLQRFRLFSLLAFIFFFTAAILLVPVHFLSTIQSPKFISYMGIGASDIRIDLRGSDGMRERFDSMVARIAGDMEVARFSPLVSSRFTLLRENGETEPMTVESGDFSIFQLDYLRGRAPVTEDEIALSYLNARELEKQSGDTLLLRGGGRERLLRISGIYQDVTNGGRTAKAAFPGNPEEVLSYTVSLDLKPGVSASAKVHEYGEAFHPARVTGLESYLSQTLGNTIQQLTRVTMAALATGLAVSILITSLFLRMLIARDAQRIAVMKSLGFPLHALRLQYLTTALVLLFIGIVSGSLFSNTAGQSLVSLLWSFMGAAEIHFVIDPLRAYLLIPLVLMLTVTITTLISIRGIREQNIAAAVAE